MKVRKRTQISTREDTAPFNTGKLVKDELKTLGWDVLPTLPPPPYSPGLAPSCYHLFRSMQHALFEQYFVHFAEVENWLEE